MRKSLRFLGLVVWLSVSVVAQEAAQDYAIKLHQPLKSGQRYKLTATGRDTSTRSMTENKQIVKKEAENSAYEFESNVTVVEVDAVGRPIKEEHAVARFFKTKKNNREQVFPEGTKMTASLKDGSPAYEVDGKPVSAEIAGTLRYVVSLSDGKPTLDELIGTDERKKVGDSWKISEERARQYFQTKRHTFQIQNITNQTKLVSVTRNNGVDVLHVVSTLGSKLEKADADFADELAVATTWIGAFPADVSRVAVEQIEIMRVTSKASGKPNTDASGIQMTFIGERYATNKTQILK